MYKLKGGKKIYQVINMIYEKSSTTFFLSFFWLRQTPPTLSDDCYSNLTWVSHGGNEFHTNEPKLGPDVCSMKWNCRFYLLPSALLTTFAQIHQREYFICLKKFIYKLNSLRKNNFPNLSHRLLLISSCANDFMIPASLTSKV